MTKGFDNWKKALQKFDTHAKSSGHLACVFAEHHPPKTSIIVQLDSSLKKKQDVHRRMLVVEVSSIIFLIRQGLALRGHTDWESNLTQLLIARSTDIPGLLEYVNDGRYLSHDVVNELVESVALTILRQKLEQVRHVMLSNISLLEMFQDSFDSFVDSFVHLLRLLPAVGSA